MSDALNSTIIFLIYTLFDLYLVALSVRLILVWERADYINPIFHFIIKITQPIVAPLRRIIPTVKGFEFATLIWMIFIELIKYILLSLLVFGEMDFFILLIYAFMGIIKLVLNVFFYSILISAIMSFLTPGRTPVSDVLEQISLPILTPLRRMIPPVGGFDITPIPALIILQVLIRLL